MTTLTRRADIVRDQLTRPPFGARRFEGLPVRVGITGSGETLVLLAWSPADLARERTAGTRVLRRLGVRPSMRVANALPGALATPGSLLLGDVVEELGGLDVPLGDVTTEAEARRAWELFDRVEPDVLVLEPRTAGALLAAVPAGRRPWWKGLVWLRCPASAERVSIPAAAGFAGWGRTWLAVPEVASFVAGSCPAGRFHVDESVRAEVIEEAIDAPLPPGRTGMLALAALGESAPSLRYASGLAARIAAGPCPCGDDGTCVELV